jgi:hypothetical protein
MTTVDASTARALKREHEALRGKTTPTKSLKCIHNVMVESLNMQGVEEDWQLKVLLETDNL